MIGFDSLTDEGCEHLLARYDDDLAAYERGEINYPCGSKPRTVKRWRAELVAEILLRRARAAATPFNPPEAA